MTPLPFSRTPWRIRIQEIMDNPDAPALGWFVAIAVLLPALWALGRLWAGE